MTKSDKTDRAYLFRTRLARAVDLNATNQSALARAVGVDRSTISQLLSGKEARLPNAQVVAESAAVLGVSADWLLGLTDRPERPGEVLDAQLVLTEAERSSADEQIDAWHHEAAGYKIRHVPATLPDMLKTGDMLKWEYGPQLARTTRQAIGAVDDQFDWFVSHESDYEIALPIHELESFARAEGYYRGLPLAIRLDQLDRLLHLVEAFYPSLRLYLFDARQVFSAPITVYGPLLAVVYLGQHYIAFRETSRIRIFTRHFDGLVREAVTDARDIQTKLTALRHEIAGRAQITPL
jgi:transcriptional regulator with XRE-family HTH domain